MRLRDAGGVPMVYVSHDAAEMRRLATEVVMLEQGRMVAAGGIDLLPHEDAKRPQAPPIVP